MDTNRFYGSIVRPTLSLLAAMSEVAIKATDEAAVELVAIAGQESVWKHRRQIGIGQYYPQTVGARGYWQCESTWGGPVAISDVFQKAPRQLAAVCAYLDVPCDPHAVYEAVAWHDTLACATARLILWIDPNALPKVGDKQGGWDCYVKNWKPGAPHPDVWAANYEAALLAVGTPNGFA